MKRLASWNVWGVVLFAWLAACAPLQFTTQELRLRQAKDADGFDVLLVYDGIQCAKAGEGTDPIDATLAFVQRVASGRRELLIWDWPLHIDLDEVGAQLASDAEKTPDAWGAWKRAGSARLAAVHVVAAGYCSDANGRLALYQALHIDGAGAFVEWLDDALRIGVAESAAMGRLDSDLRDLDPATRAEWAKLAAEKRRWLTLAEGELRVSLPFRTSDFARLFAENSAARDARLMLGVLAGAASRVVFADGQGLLAFELGAGGARWKFEGTADEYDARLADRLRSSKALPETLPKQDELVRSFLGR